MCEPLSLKKKASSYLMESSEHSYDNNFNINLNNNNK